MEPVPIGNGEIRVLPLAFESFGVRSMATYVETDDLKLIIDPGSALGPRFNLSPHEREYLALARSRERIQDAARGAEVLTVSHYHFDHYVPSFEDWLWVWSSPELAERLYRGKLILAKDIATNINFSQRQTENQPRYSPPIPISFASAPLTSGCLSACSRISGPCSTK